MVFLVFEPGGLGARTLQDAERVVFLREKFSWAALFLGPLWLIWHALWLGLVLWLVLFFALSAAVVAFDLNRSLIAGAIVLPSLLLAFEATALRRRKLIHTGLREAGVVIAEDSEIAERRFFAAWEKEVAAPPPQVPLAAKPMPPMQPSSVLGLFPEPGAGR